MSEVIKWMKEKNVFYLIAGFIFSVFSIARFNMVLSIYIWPFCFLHYLHKNHNKIIPLIIVSLCIMISNIIRWNGCSNTNILADIIMGIYFSIINILPFIIDDIFYNKIALWKNIFIFPLSVAICEFLFSFIPFANFNIYAYSHRNNLQFLQIISLFGCYFLSFIIALFSSVLDYAIFIYTVIDNKIITKFIYMYGIIVLIIYFFGVIRLLIPQNGETYNIGAALGKSQYLYEIGKESVLSIDEYINYINSTLYMANNSNCQIMTYAEEAFAIMIEDKNEIIKRTANLAEYYNIFVLLSLDICYNDTYNTNEAILISDEGRVLYNYQKQHLIPYIEKDYYEEMDKVQVIDTKLGKITVAICYDINFPYYLNSLSREHFDILLVPSWDWDSIAEYHSNEAKYRAIEGGFNLIKNTANGIVISNDVRGRALSYYIGKDCLDYFVVSTVNQKGVITLYSYFGIFFNYLYIAALICFLISGKIENCFCNRQRRASSIFSGSKELIGSNDDNDN